MIEGRRMHESRSTETEKCVNIALNLFAELNLLPPHLSLIITQFAR
jgi:hypothetical protein